MADLEAVHERLQDIWRRNQGDFAVTRGSTAGLTVEMPGYQGKPWGYVGGTRLGKRYVSYYLMSVYAQPELVASMSPELKRRMQGKSCFNFATIDEPLFAELEALTATAVARHPDVLAAALAERSRR